MKVFTTIKINGVTNITEAKSLADAEKTVRALFDTMWENVDRAVVTLCYPSATIELKYFEGINFFTGARELCVDETTTEFENFILGLD